MPSADRATPAVAPDTGIRPEATLLYAGQRIVVGRSGITLGRGEGNEVGLRSPAASRWHAEVRYEGGAHWLVDVGSKNGTYLNGQRLEGRARLASGDAIRMGGDRLRFLDGRATRLASAQIPVKGTQAISLGRGILSIGRDAANDVVLDDPNVSRFHAEAHSDAGDVQIADLGSNNGTYLNGEAISTARLSVGSEVQIGPYRLVFDGRGLLARDERGAMVMDARRLGVRVGEKTLLRDVSLSIQPGAFVAIIGESGAGKTTLLKSLAGVVTPSEGSVTVNGEDLRAHLTSIGYVPQDEIVHPGLTPAEAVGYAARLRLPSDVTRDERAQVVADVLEQLNLTEHAGTQVRWLSGGQRRRVGVAVELVSRPSLLFLDEPTTGLDPGLERRMMTALRRLSDPSRAVVIVTHATQSLELCDAVAVMGRGGVLCYFGAPAGAAEFFGVRDYNGIYEALEQEDPEDFAAKCATDPMPEEPVRRSHDAPRPERAAGASRSLHVRVLVRRYFQVLRRDRRNLLILLGQVPAIALAVVILFGRDVFAARGAPGDAAQLLFLLVTTAIWLGAIDAAREVAKERSVVDRERAIGVRPSSYVASKAVVLFGLGVVQAALLASIVLALRPLHERPGVYLGVGAALVLTTFAAVAMGLVVSSLAKSEDQAVSLVPLVLIPQLFFAGAIIPAEKMSAAVRVVSDAVFAKWSFALSGTLVDMNERIATGRPALREQYGREFFDVGLLSGYAILTVFVLALLAAAWALLARRRT